MKDENELHLGIISRFGNNKKPTLEFGIINNKLEAPYNPNNSVIFYNSETKQNVIAIACIVDCPFDIANKEHQNENDILNFGKQITESTKDSINITETKATTESTKQLESTNPNIPTQPFTYQDSNITAKEIINDDNTTSLVIESKTNLLEYQGNTADSLMTGLSAVFASMATLAEKYGVDKRLKEVEKGIFGTKGRILSSVLFQTQGASVSLTYNYGNNDNDLLKAGVSVGIEFVANTIAVGVATALSAPVWALVGISALVAVGVNFLLNTQWGKENLDQATQFIREVINSLKSKLRDFFSLFDSNPSKYELVSNPSLESNDYKSLIELLLDSNSTAKDIDSLLHSFPNYLKKDSQISTTESNKLESDFSTQSTSHTPSNTILTTLDTSQPLLHLNVFLEDSFIPVHNATIRLVPFRTMIANKTQDSIQEQIIQNGKVSFNLPSNAEKFEFFILDTRFLEKAKGDDTRITNNYANTPNPTITLNLISKPSLYFNGYELQIHQNNKITQSFKAYSGNALSEQEKQNLQNDKGYKKFVTYEYTDSTQNIIQYFCLDTEWQKQKDKGAIETKGRTLANVLFQIEGASVSLTYNYGNNGNDLLKAEIA